jgi:hypothetical protein
VQTLVPEQSWLSAAVRDELHNVVGARLGGGGPSWSVVAAMLLATALVAAGLTLAAQRINFGSSPPKKFI